MFGRGGGGKLTSLARLTILAGLREIQQAPADLGHVAASHRDTEVRQRATAREDDAALLRVVRRPGDLAPVCGDNGRVDDQERGACVCDRDPGPALHGLRLGIPDRDGLRGELPEAVLRVDRNGGETALELGGVDGAELVAAGGAVFEVCGKDRLAEQGADIVEEGLLRGGADGVELAEGEADEAVGRAVGDEGGGDLGREADGLGGDGGAADVDGVGADGAKGEGAVAVGDVEGGAGGGLEGGGFGWVEGRVAGLGGGGELGVEDPPEKGC